jgi:hypothetical protein
MKRVLVIDDGGAKGPIAATVLSNIVQIIRRDVVDEFDLVWGTSVGAIISGIMATGRLEMSEFYPLFLDSIPRVFEPQPHIPFIGNKYSREPLNSLIRRYIGGEFKMKHCRTKFVCTSVNMVDGRTHFFKSWESKDGELNLLEAVLRSYAAPYYFGSIKDKAGNAVWLDGGTGNMSSPTVEAYVEVCRQGWLDTDDVHIVSLGCGESPFSMPYSRAASYKALRQIYYFMNPMDGGLARRQCDRTNEEALRGIAGSSRRLTFQRIEKHDLAPDMDVMDGVKYLKDYIRIGMELSKDVDYTHLM